MRKCTGADPGKKDLKDESGRRNEAVARPSAKTHGYGRPAIILGKPAMAQARRAHELQTSEEGAVSSVGTRQSSLAGSWPLAPGPNRQPLPFREVARVRAQPDAPLMSRLRRGSLAGGPMGCASSHQRRRSVPCHGLVRKERQPMILGKGNCGWMQLAMSMSPTHAVRRTRSAHCELLRPATWCPAFVSDTVRPAPPSSCTRKSRSNARICCGTEVGIRPRRLAASAHAPGLCPYAMPWAPLDQSAN